MSLRVRLLFNFPYFKILALSIILALLGLASIVLSALGFVKEIWGHYVGSGIWCGTFVFVTGICGVAAAHWKGIYSVRLFLGTSIVSCFLSVAELGLSAGGLDYNSNFYIKGAHFEITDHGPTKLIHGLLLMISILQFALSFICAFISAYHACFKKYSKTRTPAVTEQSRKRFLRDSCQSSNASTSSRALLHTTNDDHKRKRRKRSTRHERNEQNSIENNHQNSRSLLRESQQKPPDCNRDIQSVNEQRRQRSRPRSSHRPRRDEPEPEAEHIQRVQDNDVIVENASPQNTVPQFVALQPAALVCSYYNDEPPIPIDEDDELPPYEEVIKNAECENDSMVNGPRSGTYDSEPRRSSCSSYDHESTNSSGSSSTYIPRRNIHGLKNLLISPENYTSRTLNDHANPNDYKNQENVTSPFIPPLPPKLATAEREAFLKEFWLSDHPQGISYCGFSRNDCPVKENIPRADRVRSFYRQQSREREFVKHNVLDSRRHSNMENGNVDDQFGIKNQFFKDYVKSQPNIRGKLHDSRKTSTSSICSLPSDNPPPKPPRLFSFDHPVKLELKDQSYNSVKNQNENEGHLRHKDSEKSKNYANVMYDSENSSEMMLESKQLYMNLEVLGKSQTKRQECNTSLTDKNKQNSNRLQKPDGERRKDKLGNVTVGPDLKPFFDLSLPIGHSTPKSSLIVPTPPGLSPVETSKPVVQPRMETQSNINRFAKEEFAKLEDSPKIINVKSTESKTADGVSENQIQNNSDNKIVANEDRFDDTVHPLKRGQTESTPKIDDKLSLRPYLIRDDGKRRTVGKSRSDFVNNMTCGQNQNFSTCAPSPEVKYLTENSGHRYGQQTDAKKSYCQTQETKNIEDETTNAISARKQLFSPEKNPMLSGRKQSKLPVLSLRPVSFDFTRDTGNEQCSNSQSLNRTPDENPKGDKAPTVNHTSEDSKPASSYSDTSEEEQAVYLEEEEISAQQSQNSSTSNGHKKPIYSILL